MHGDHTGGNVNFAKLGATIFAREELRERLMHPVLGPNGPMDPVVPEIGLPVVTFEDKITFHLDGETVDAIPMRKAHTDGDSIVYFHNADAIMVGDFFRTVGSPNIDRVNGGTLDGTLAALAQLIALAGPNTKLIPGHGVTVERSAVIANRDMILAMRDKIAQLIQQGKSLPEVIAEHPTAEFDSHVTPVSSNGERNADRFVGQLYAELKPAK
jgi:glyoxylase-like metal-dependent hydrolase (beta-lactamase superfamily II)